jgi:hypothetical protein
LVDFFDNWLLSGSQTAFGTTFRDTGGYQKAGTSSLKRVTGRIQLVSDFIEASRNFGLDFKKTAKIVKTLALLQKVPFRFLGP